MEKEQLTNSEAVLKYVDWLDENGGLEMIGIDRDRLICACDYAVNMLFGLPRFCDISALYPALGILLAYVANNGEENEAIKIRALQMIVKMAHATLESGANPLARILDFKYNKM